MKKFLSVLMAATMLVGVMALTGCGGDATEPTTDEANNQSEPASTTATDLKTVTEGVLTMSTNAAFPPYESTDDSGNVVGIDADIAAAIAEKLGLKLQIDDMDFDGALAAAQSGKSDIVMAGVTVNEERQLVLDFTVCRWLLSPRALISPPLRTCRASASAPSGVPPVISFAPVLWRTAALARRRWFPMTMPSLR